MNIAEIGKQLYNLVVENSHDFSPHYNLVEKDFMTQYNQFQGLKNDVRIDVANDDSYDLVKLSVLVSDFTSIFPYDEDNFLYTFNPKEKERKIIGPKKYLDKISSEIPDSKMYAGYGCVAEEQIEEVFDKLYPFIEANKLFIRPEKIVFVANLEGDGETTIHPADSNGDSNEWRVANELIHQKSYPLFDKKSSVDNHQKLSNILIPYIKGVETKEFCKIIIDEEDLLSSFRLQTKTYLEYLKNNNPDSEVFKMDVIQPKLDLLNRKFKTISNIHKLKIGGATVGTAGLMLLSMTQPGLTAALSQFITFGLGTVGFIKSEAEYQENIDKLKDLPEFLLWKLNKS